MERRLGLSEFQTDGTDTEKARDAKLELTAGLKNWWTQEDLSCLVGWWLERISGRYKGNNECLALKPSSLILNWILCLISRQWRERMTIRPGRIGIHRSTQPCIPPGSLNRVPASAGGKDGILTSVGVAGNTVWSHMACEFPVAVWQSFCANCYTLTYLLTYLLTYSSA